MWEWNQWAKLGGMREWGDVAKLGQARELNTGEIRTKTQEEPVTNKQLKRETEADHYSIDLSKGANPDRNSHIHKNIASEIIASSQETC